MEISPVWIVIFIEEKECKENVMYYHLDIAPPRWQSLRQDLLATVPTKLGCHLTLIQVSNIPS